MQRFIHFSVSIIFVFAFIVTAQPINPDGSFEDATTGEKFGTDIPGWSIITGGTGTAIFEIVEDDVYDGSKSLKVQLLTLGTNAWDIQIVNEPFNVEAGTEYKYSIWARADVAGVILNFTIGAPDYSEFGRLGQASLSDQWQEYTFNFTAPAGASEARAPIHLSEAANNAYIEVAIYLDNLSIEEAGAVDVEQENLLPSKFSLIQNYPNPFNPTTTITFTLPSRSDVHLSLVDVLGKVVREIAVGSYEAGLHKVELNASDLPSGVYFYRLEAGGFVDIKKLILMK